MPHPITINLNFKFDRSGNPTADESTNQGLEQIIKMQASTVSQLLTIIDTVLSADASDKSALADAQNQIATLKANDAALDALQPQIDATIAKAAAASVGSGPSVPTTPVTPVTPAPTDGGTVVTPVVTPAPDVTPATPSVGPGPNMA